MLFKFPKPKLNLDIVTYRPEILERYPIDHTKKFIPRWYKNMPANTSNTPVHEPTLKGCVAVQDLFNNGIVIPIWSDCVMYKDDKFNIRLLDMFGKPINLNTMDWSFTLELEKLYQNII